MLRLRLRVWRMLRKAAADQGRSLQEFVSLLDADDEHAWSAVAAEVQDWDDIDWEELIEAILRLIEILIVIFG